MPQAVGVVGSVFINRLQEFFQLGAFGRVKLAYSAEKHGVGIRSGRRLLVVVQEIFNRHAEYLGNARDTIDVRGGTTLVRDTLLFSSVLAYRMQNGLTADTASLVVVGPGARFAFADSTGVTIRTGARLDARGQASRRINSLIVVFTGWVPTNKLTEI